MEVGLLVNGIRTKPEFVLTWRYRQGLWRYHSEPTAGHPGGIVPTLPPGPLEVTFAGLSQPTPRVGHPFFLLSTRSAILCPLSHPHSIPPNRRDLSVESVLVASFEVISPTSSHFLVEIFVCLALFLPFANPRFVVFLSIYYSNWITMGCMMFMLCMKYLR
jgi:hypothetical protein